MAAGPNIQPNFRVLIADSDTTNSRRLSEFLREKGFGADHATSGKAAREKIMTTKPHFVICDLTLPEMNAPQLLRWISSPDFKTPKPKVFVMSAHNIVANIKECMKLGASDYIVKPYKVEDIITRLVFHIQNKREIGSDKQNIKLEGADLYLNLLDIVLRECLSGRNKDEIFLNVTKMIAITLKAVRCSLVKISDDLQMGTVMASSDDRAAKGFILDMNKYPEMLHVMNTNKAVVIEDLEYDPQLAKIKDLVKGIQFNSMIVCPVVENGSTWGVISARMDRNHSKFNERDIRFIQLVGQIVSVLMGAGSGLPHELFSKKLAS